MFSQCAKASDRDSPGRGTVALRTAFAGQHHRWASQLATALPCYRVVLAETTSAARSSRSAPSGLRELCCDLQFAAQRLLTGQGVQSVFDAAVDLQELERRAGIG